MASTRPFANRQPQSDAAGDRLALGRIERLEDMGAHLLRNAVTLIAHGDPQALLIDGGSNTNQAACG